MLTGSDPSLTMHVESLKDKVLRGEITQFVWIDNRDMLADGLTKLYLKEKLTEHSCLPQRKDVGQCSTLV